MKIKGRTGPVKMENNFDVHSKSQLRCNLLYAEVLTDGIPKHVDMAKVKKTKKIYFAAPWFDERSEKLYSTCERIVNRCDDYSPYVVYFPRQEINDSPLDAFNKNIKHIKECDVLIALVSKKDVGTAWEIGMAYSMGKKIILLGYDETTFLSHTNVMLAFTGICTTIKELSNVLCDLNFETVKINNEWEGIE